MTKIMVRIIVVIPHTPPLPPNNLRGTQTLQRTQKSLMIREEMGQVFGCAHASDSGSAAAATAVSGKEAASDYKSGNKPTY